MLGRCVRKSRDSVFTSGRLQLVVVHQGSGYALNAISVASFMPLRSEKTIKVTIRDGCERRKCTSSTLGLLYRCTFGFLFVGRLCTRVTISGRPDLQLFGSYKFARYKMLGR